MDKRLPLPDVAKRKLGLILEQREQATQVAARLAAQARGFVDAWEIVLEIPEGWIFYAQEKAFGPPPAIEKEEEDAAGG